jgi:hypothetical protein
VVLTREIARFPPHSFIKPFDSILVFILIDFTLPLLPAFEFSPLMVIRSHIAHTHSQAKIDLFDLDLTSSMIVVFIIGLIDFEKPRLLRRSLTPPSFGKLGICTLAFQIDFQ